MLIISHLWVNWNQSYGLDFLFFAFWTRNRGPKNAILGPMLDFTKSRYFMEIEALKPHHL